MNIYIDDIKLPINNEDFATVSDNFRKRVIRILYLKEDLYSNQINEYDLKSYINALIWDFYGAYMIFNECRFLNCICELEGIKQNIHDDFIRKKVLDLASFINSINNK